MKPVIFSHGEKGGVGKSTVAALMCDALIFRGEKRIAIVDGDATTADVTRRYGAHAASSAAIGLADPSEKERAINKKARSSASASRAGRSAASRRLRRC